MVIIGEKVWVRSRFDELLGRRLWLARGLARMTQAEAGDALGVTRETVAKWEMGVRRPGLPMIRKLTKTYGITPDYLLG